MRALIVLLALVCLTGCKTKKDCMKEFMTCTWLCDGAGVNIRTGHVEPGAKERCNEGCGEANRTCLSGTVL